MSKYIIIAIISSALFGINTIVQKRITGADPITFTLLAMASGTVFVWIYWLFDKTPKIHTAQGISHSLISGVLSALAFLLFIIALRQCKVSTVVIINSFSAVIAVLLSVALMYEKLNITQIIGVIMGISGVILVTL